jgi:peptidoglycan/xylan/chitin deacetylase (PgdA/CDA1 family)
MLPAIKAAPFIALLCSLAFTRDKAGPGPQTIAPLAALTFDDGPSSEYTAAILDTLKRYGVHATFFVIGRNAEKYPELVKRESMEGHAIGNHTYSHPLLTQFETKEQLHREIQKTQDIIARETGRRPDLFRPPHGWRSPWLISECERDGYNVVNWTIDPKDWKHPASNVIVKRVMRKCGEVTIVLLHDGLELKNDPGQENTVRALSTIIGEFRLKGYRFVTINELIADSTYRQEFRALVRVIAEPSKAYR